MKWARQGWGHFMQLGDLISVHQLIKKTNRFIQLNRRCHFGLGRLCLFHNQISR